MPAKTTPPPDDLSNPYGYSEMDWAAQLDPAYAAARAEIRRLSVGEDGTLSVKVKELIVLGVLASRGLQYGVEAHMRRALDYGATKEELFEAIKAATVPGGGVAHSVGVRALHALEQAGGFAPPTPAPSRARPAGHHDLAGQSSPTAHPPTEDRLDTGRVTSSCLQNRAKALTLLSIQCTLSLDHSSWRTPPATTPLRLQRRWV
jgi:AhpD family alkylhydroperoxidase